MKLQISQSRLTPLEINVLPAKCQVKIVIERDNSY
jgi:hypothetical protein